MGLFALPEGDSPEALVENLFDVEDLPDDLEDLLSDDDEEGDNND